MWDMIEPLFELFFLGNFTPQPPRKKISQSMWGIYRKHLLPIGVKGGGGLNGQIKKTLRFCVKFNY